MPSHHMMGKPLASIFPPAAVGHVGESARDLPGERGPAGGSRLAARTAPALQAKLDAHSEVLVGIAQQLGATNHIGLLPHLVGLADAQETSIRAEQENIHHIAGKMTLRDRNPAG